MLHPNRARTFKLALLSGVVAAAAAAGALRGIWASPGQGPFAGIPILSESEAQPQDPIVAERGLAQVEPPDPALAFPVALADLPVPPSDLAVDASGALWFVLFDGSATTSTLYRHEPASSDVKRFSIPRSNGSGVASEIEVDPRGHIIWAEGELVLDFDPSAGAYKEYKLDKPSKAASFIPPAGTYVTGMDLDENGNAYVSRMNVAAVAEINFQTGGVREIPYPESFGPVYDLAVADGSLWITNPYDMQDGPKAQAGRVDLKNGTYQAMDVSPAVFAEGPSRQLFGTSFARGGLAEVEGQVLSAQGPTGTALAGLGVPEGDVVVVDQRSGVVWASNGVVGGILRFDPSSASVRSYPVGTYLTQTLGCPIPPMGQPDMCDDSIKVSPQVTGLAVAPNGDLYFSDSAFNRIGVIHAGQ